MSDQQLLTIVLDNNIKDDAVDVVMELGYVSGFTLSNAYGFSRQHVQYDIKEQVEGYRQLYRLEVIHHPNNQQDLLTAFSELNTRFKLKYWITPLLDCGEV